MKPIDCNCSHQFPDLSLCGAGAGEPCRWPAGKPEGVEFHPERLYVAQPIDEQPDVPQLSQARIDAAIDAEVERLGIV